MDTVPVCDTTQAAPAAFPLASGESPPAVPPGPTIPPPTTSPLVSVLSDPQGGPASTPSLPHAPSPASPQAEGPAQEGQAQGEGAPVAAIMESAKAHVHRMQTFIAAHNSMQEDLDALSGAKRTANSSGGESLPSSSSSSSASTKLEGSQSDSGREQDNSLSGLASPARATFQPLDSLSSSASSWTNSTPIETPPVSDGILEWAKSTLDEELLFSGDERELEDEYPEIPSTRGRVPHPRPPSPGLFLRHTIPHWTPPRRPNRSPQLSSQMVPPPHQVL
ncbi:hypothetical protein ACA910_022568 [Epithemia clementina (nom. ined.)]